MSVINQNLLLTPEGYQISRSVRLRSSASAYFNRTPASAGNRKTWTWSGWVKRGALGAAQDIFSQYSGSVSDFEKFNLRFASSDKINIDAYSFNFLISTQVFRDPSAWYHIVFAFDTTQATANNRARLYVNGTEVAAFDTRNNPSLNTDYGVNMANTHRIGSNSVSLGVYFDGYLTEVNFIDGQALTPSSFGETDAVTGVWKPKKYAGTYGTNGFYLNFSDNSAATAAAIGKDSSGNGNNWTPNNVSVTAGSTYDSMLDVPTMWADGGNGRGNYATLNPLSIYVVNPTDGNLAFSGTSAGGIGSMGVSSGKYYWESVYTAIGSGDGVIVGVRSAESVATGAAENVGYYGGGTANGKKIIDGGTGTSYGSTWTTGDVIGVALDIDAGSITFYKNNVSQGAISYTFTGKSWVSFNWRTGSAGTNTGSVNFGQRPFAYTPPTGFKALNTQNLPDATIKKGNDYFDAVTYTGTGSARSVTGLGFQPDLVWVKGRSVAYSHLLTDSVRGVSKRLVSDSTAAEVTDTDTLTAFNSDGFSWGTGIGGNQNAATYVAWQWKESASAGFDIVTYTGNATNRSISHSLGVAPKLIITKNRSAAANWLVYHADLGATKYLGLNQTIAAQTNIVAWNNTAPTSTDFTVGTDSSVNGNGNNMVAYLFSEVAGYSKFGSYTGNGSADGPFVYLGFRPKFVLMKSSSLAYDWYIHDEARDTYNSSQSALYPNKSNAEEYWGAGSGIDILSNGFKLRTAGNINLSGATYIYAAFAENPFKNSLAR